MAVYSYEAMGADGKRRRGTLEAESEKHAQQLLSSRGEIPIKLTAKKTAEPSAFMDRLRQLNQKVKTRDLILFTRQFSTMVRVGISATNLLSIMEEQTEHPVLKKVVKDMGQAIQEGVSFSEAFKMFPHIFSPLYCSMVHAGEVSGTIPEIMNQLIRIIEHDDAMRSDIKKALQYPKIVLFALVIAFVVLLVVVFPRFSAMYSDAGLTLPFPTRVCMALSDSLIHSWYWVVGGLAVVIAGVVTYFRTPAGRMQLDTFLINMPIVGGLIQKSNISRFSSVFAVMQANGMNVLDSMQIIRDTVTNRAMAGEFDELISKLSHGEGLAIPMKEARYFTPMLVNMVAIGEETGNMTEMLTVVSEHYDIETQYSINQMISAIGPLLTVLLAVVIGFFALAIYMPMWDLVKMVQ